ncbi:hypothetical protein ACMA5K_33930 [Bradyrhizobium diazoefficiens]|uniref:hypothetical protein n=1 Tax=Bradyrhizobium diazoefficiens TaxID=1355477 RepID=UPI0015B49258|nr:hypothetical protein [Bradyrhizobium diazoefficiens]QLD45620.1 hypothetical protein HUW42_33590 [Bradyrhizobium diazoefficiens]
MSFKPASLAQLFEPPEGLRGFFGWLCGYSADAGFLENAVERFSGLIGKQRAHQGRVSLALMLDPGNPQILPADVPGVLHLPVKSAQMPFKLLHAKVAVLGFRQGDHVVIRVVVSTGNWTRQTLEESLDLAWHIDVNSRSKNSSDKAVRQDQVDLAAAWSFLSWVRDHFDTRSLNPTSGLDGETAAHVERLAAHAAGLGKRHRDYKARFFDSRDTSLLEQLPHLVRVHAGSVARNYVAIGSGFYESAQAARPHVPGRIFDRLREAGLLTASCERDIFVNPRACQAIADHRSMLEARGWRIRPAQTPGYFGNAPRDLHAKFICSAGIRDGSNNVSSPWIYLGSGNLTDPGFVQKAGSKGNLEAGVLVVPDRLVRKQTQHSDPATVVTNLLPIHYDDEASLTRPLQAGEDMPDRGVAFSAPPVALLLWEEARSVLVAQGELGGPFQVLDPDGHPCERLPDGGYAWRAGHPRQVTVSWVSGQDTHRAVVPVLDQYGRFCAAELAPLDLEQAWIQLASFPMPPGEEELGGAAESDVDGAALVDGATQVKSSAYPIRMMMTLVEDIAARQALVSQPDWMTWCNRLEQVLIQAKDSPTVQAFRTMKLNPLHPLLQSAFRPPFAADHTPEGKRYEAALQRIVEGWQLADLPALGAAS